MRVNVRPMLNKGRNMPHKEQLTHPPFVGDFSVAECRDPELGRSRVSARLTDESNGNDILPELGDARLVWAAKKKLHFVGYERIEAAVYAQTWSVEVL